MVLQTKHKQLRMIIKYTDDDILFSLGLDTDVIIGVGWLHREVTLLL